MTRAEGLAGALQALEARLVTACAAAGRDRADVTLVAVSKTRPVADVLALRELGVRDFGENRAQEAKEKARAVPDVRWHFVGSLQTNKARSVASYAAAVHSVDRAALVDPLAAGAGRRGSALDVFVQVSLDDDPRRGGAAVADVPALADAVAGAADLRLLGLMAVAPQEAEPAAAFGLLHELAVRLRADHPQARWISAGMTGDLEQALAAGATHVRVGTALFGRREPVLR